MSREMGIPVEKLVDRMYQKAARREAAKLIKDGLTPDADDEDQTKFDVPGAEVAGDSPVIKRNGLQKDMSTKSLHHDTTAETQLLQQQPKSAGVIQGKFQFGVQKAYK